MDRDSDVFLAERTAERIVEIGPADTLGVMAKRTLASKYEAYDAAKSVQRQILCYNKDAKEIYYDVDPVEEEPRARPPPPLLVTPPALPLQPVPRRLRLLRPPAPDLLPRSR